MLLYHGLPLHGLYILCLKQLMPLQAKAQHAYANGTALASASSGGKAGKPAGKEPSALVRAACLDHATGVGIAVSHINEGKLEEAMEILDYIISSTTGPHNTGAHIARGTARAMLRDLEGEWSCQDIEPCLSCCTRGAAAAAWPPETDACAIMELCEACASCQNRYSWC